MKRPAVFFDRDNTLIASEGYLGDPAKVALIDGAANAVARARQYGFKVITISNQSGVARGMFTEADVQAVNARMDELLRAANASAIIERHEYCPFHPVAVVEEYRQVSELRKPRPGMLLRAAEDLNLDLSRSWLIGDAPRDIEAGKAAGCRTILFTAPGLTASPAADAPSDVVPDFTAASLREALEIIAREAFVKGAAQSKPAPSHETPEVPSEPSDGADEAPAADAPGPSEALTDEVPLAAPTPTIAAAPASPPPAEDVEASVPVKRQAGAGPRADVKRSAPPTRTEALLEQILSELKHRGDASMGEFSISKLLAGTTQVVSLGALVLAYYNRTDHGLTAVYLQFAIALQTLTIALLIMGRQR